MESNGFVNNEANQNFNPSHILVILWNFRLYRVPTCAMLNMNRASESESKFQGSFQL